MAARGAEARTAAARVAAKEATRADPTCARQAQRDQRHRTQTLLLLPTRLVCWNEQTVPAWNLWGPAARRPASRARATMREHVVGRRHSHRGLRANSPRRRHGPSGRQRLARRRHG
eukprot:3245245-Prymnesium_polylepis.1